MAVQVTFKVQPTRILAGNLFWPRPRVESQVVRMDLDPRCQAPHERSRIVALARRMLQQRRKGLRRVVRDLLDDGEAADQLLAASGLDPSRRAESLALEELASLAQGPLGLKF